MNPTDLNKSAVFVSSLVIRATFIDNAAFLCGEWKRRFQCYTFMPRSNEITVS